MVLSGKYCLTTQDCSRKASWLLVETEELQKPFHLWLLITGKEDIAETRPVDTIFLAIKSLMPFLIGFNNSYQGTGLQTSLFSSLMNRSHSDISDDIHNDKKS